MVHAERRTCAQVSVEENGVAAAWTATGRMPHGSALTEILRWRRSSHLAAFDVLLKNKKKRAKEKKEKKKKKQPIRLQS